MSNIFLATTITSAPALTTVDLIKNGNIFKSALSDSNGNIVFTFSNSDVLTNEVLIIYVPGNSTLGNVVLTVPTQTNSIINLAFSANTVTVVQTQGFGGAALPSVSSIATARGSVSDSGLLFTASGGNLTVTPSDNFVVTNSGGFNLNGNVSTSSGGNITLAGVTSIGASATLTATGGTININGTVDSNSSSSQSLTLNANQVSITSAIGSQYAPASLSVTGSTTLGANITTIGAQTYNTATLISTNVTLISTTGTVTENNGIDSSVANTNSLTIDGNIVSIVGSIGALSPPATINLTGTVDISVGANITAHGNTTVFNSPVVLTTNTVVTDAGGITYNSTIDGAFTLTDDSTGLNVTFNGLIGSTTPLVSLTVTGVTGIIMNAGSVHTSGAQTYNNAITMQSATNLIGTNISAGAIDNGGFALTLTNSAASSITGIISGVGTLTQAGTGTTTLSGANTYQGDTIINAGVLAISSDGNLGTVPGSVTANSIQLGAGTLQSNGTFTLNTNRGITLSGIATIQSASGTLTYGGKIDGAHPLTLLGTGSLILNGNIGSATSLTTITSNANLTSLTINDTSVTTTSTQTYNGPLLLNNSSTQTFTSSSTLTLTGATWTGTNAIDLTSSAGIVLNGAMSGVSGSLNLTAGALASTITTGANGSVLVANFNLIQGTWSQVTASLPGFTVTNNFQIASGSLPSTTALFRRATGGTGTPGSPYTITDVYGLQGIASTSTSLAQSFSLANGINASGTSNWNSGAGFIPIGGGATFYSGTFNGQSFAIANLFINTTANLTGLFGATSNATISNVGLTNANITGFFDVGALIGDMTGTTSVSNSYSTGTVSGGYSASTSMVGGLIGDAVGTLSNDYSTASVGFSSPGTSGSTAYIGGLVGALGNSSSITGSFATGAVITAKRICCSW